MVGYPESLTDPSYRSQILTLTYPLIGNYGVPEGKKDSHGITTELESDKIWASALIVGDYVEEYSHWNAKKSLSQWLIEEGVPGISGELIFVIFCFITTHEIHFIPHRMKNECYNRLFHLTWGSGGRIISL